jgi:hypothetical protein
MPLEAYLAGTALDCSRGHRICPSCVRGKLLPAALSGGGGADAMGVGERSALQLPCPCVCRGWLGGSEAPCSSHVSVTLVQLLPFCTVGQARRVCEAWQARVEQRAAEEAATAITKTPAAARALDDRSVAWRCSMSPSVLKHLEYLLGDGEGDDGGAR